MNIHYIKYTLAAVFLSTWSWYLFPQQAGNRIWWQVELRIAVTGSYAYRSASPGYEGKYSFSAQVLGALQEDEGDFIFVQAHEKTAKLTWLETAYEGNSKKSLDLAGKIKPTASLNYVFRGAEGVSFDFGMESVKVPHRHSLPTTPNFPAKKLHMPKSAGDASVNPDRAYEQGIVDGSNRVELAVKDFYNEKEINRVFKWKWAEKHDSPSWQEGHDVEVTLKILRMME